MSQEDEVRPFDLERMFLGDEFAWLLLAEVIVRTGVMYVAALVLVRFVGKRGLGQLSPFEYVIVIAMGSAAGDPMFYPDLPLMHGILVLAAIVLLQKFLLKLVDRSQPLQHFVEGVPSIVVQDGTVLDDALRREALARDELYMKLREHGVTNVGQVRYAWLEPSGELSVFKFDEEDLRHAGPSTLPAPV